MFGQGSLTGPRSTTVASNTGYRIMPLLHVNDISTGRQFPPARERSRIERMEKWNRYATRRYAGLTEESDLRLRPNIFRWLANFWRDALLADAPVFEYEDNPRTGDFIAAIRSHLIAAADLVAVDLIRYGTGVFVNRRPMEPQSVDPRFWYPVRQPDDHGQGDVDIIAYPFASGAAPSQSDGQTAARRFERGTTPQAASRLSDPEQTGLYADSLAVTVYDGQGTGTRTLYALSGLSVGAAGDSVPVMSGAPAVVAVRQGEGFYGTSDYEDIEEYIGELHNRESRVSEALDRHTNPHLAVPDGVMQTTTDGRIVVEQNGMVIPVPEGSEMPKYVQWEASFDAQHESMRRATQRILLMSGIAPILVDPESRGAVASGAALRRLAIPTVNRVRALREILTEGIKDTIVGQAALVAATGGEVFHVERDAISLRWPAELSAGISDEADAIAQLVEAGILERETAIQMVSKVRRSEAEEIANDNAQSSGPARSGAERPLQAGAE